MFGVICLFWVGLKLSAPTWYFVLLAISGFLSIISFGIKMYNAGSK